MPQFVTDSARIRKRELFGVCGSNFRSSGADCKPFITGMEKSRTIRSDLFCFAKRLRRTRLQRFYEPQAGAQSYRFVSASGLCDVGAGVRGKIREQRDDQDAHDWDGGLEPYRRLL